MTAGSSVGLKYGLRAILITMLCSPILLLLSFYLDALRDNVEYWDPTRISFGIYFMAPLIGLVFFSIPYLLGGYVLGWVLAKTSLTSNWLSIVIGMISGLMGISLIVLQQRLTIADFNWNMVIIIELWSIMLFSWMGKRIFNVLDNANSN